MPYNENISIEETIDYDVFNKHKANRKTNEKLVQRLMRSIDKRNLLKLNPILVDKEYNIIDGQHRTEAAKRLGIPIHYIVSETVTIDDMEPLNTEKETWNLDDYLNHHCNRERIHYESLANFMEQHGFNRVSLALELLHGNRNSEFHNTFKRGEYQFPNAEEEKEAVNKKRQIDEIIEYINKKTGGAKGYLYKLTFYAAMIEFFNIKSFSYDVFMKKLQYKIDLIHPCQCRSDYVRIFKEVYNYNQKDKEKILN
jgi:hypothetical protein